MFDRVVDWGLMLGPGRGRVLPGSESGGDSNFMERMTR